MDAQRLRGRFWRTASLFGLVALVATAALASGTLNTGTKRAIAQGVSPCNPETFDCITVTKETTNGDGNFDFVLAFGNLVAQPAGQSAGVPVAPPTEEFILKDHGSRQFSTANVGSVLIRETLPNGWRLVDIQCAISRGMMGWTDVADGFAVIEFFTDGLNTDGLEPITALLPNGVRSASCTFINEPVNVGGAFPALGNAAKKNQTAAAGASQPAAAAPASGLRAPSTGDAGLAATDRSHDTLSIALAASFLVSLGGVTLLMTRAGRPR
jgi:hypothetical protein